MDRHETFMSTSERNIITGVNFVFQIENVSMISNMVSITSAY